MDMEQWARVRRKVLVDGRSKRSVMSEEGLHWETLQKMLGYTNLHAHTRRVSQQAPTSRIRSWIKDQVPNDAGL